VERIMMAACGLDCSSCVIRLGPTDPAAAKTVVDWFRREGWLAEGEGMAHVVERKMYCTGCLGDRDTHWSAECWILACCVDEWGLSNCSECDAFACQRLEEWSGEYEGYRDAIARLRGLHAAAG
jgi:hypothetical protein